jgi:hypothetical protein
VGLLTLLFSCSSRIHRNHSVVLITVHAAISTFLCKTLNLLITSCYALSVFAATHPRRPLASFHGLTSIPCPLSPKSLPFNLFADPHPLNPVISILYKNRGGGTYAGLISPDLGAVSSHSCHKSFSCNTCCKQMTYSQTKPFRCNTYKKHGGGGLKTDFPLRCVQRSIPFSVHSSKFRIPQVLYLPLLRKHPGCTQTIPILEQAHPASQAIPRRLRELR